MTAQDKTVPSRQGVCAMFDRIAPRYDLLNRLLSLGLDVHWRKLMARHLPAQSGLVLLDLATGTGDQILSILPGDGRVTRAVGIDMAERMLEIARSKIAARNLQDRVELRMGDAQDVPCPDASFDVTTMSFGIRNVSDVPSALREMLRVLKPGGRALILEFSVPTLPVVRHIHLFYLRHVLPLAGRLISGDATAYRYLNQTIESFPYGKAFCDIMTGAGFTGVQAYGLCFGAATIYQGDKQ